MGVGEPGGVRIGDAERQAVVDMLRHHTGEGRLTLDEFSELVGEVYAAMTRGDLDKLIADLPEGVRPPTAGAAGTAGSTTPPAWTPPRSSERAATGADRDLDRAGEPGGERGSGRRRGERRRRFIAIMCDTQARGAWRAPPRISAFAWWGHVNLDLRSALIESPVVEIHAWAVMGGITVTVPPGIPVELDGFVLMGGSDNRIRDDEPIPDAPLVRVRARGLWGGVTVRNPRRRDGEGSRGRSRRGGRYGSLHGSHLDAALDRAERHVERALGKARRATERALPPGSLGDRIPPMPDRPDRARTDRAAPHVPAASDETTPGDHATDPSPAPGETVAPASGGHAPTGTSPTSREPTAPPARGREASADEPAPGPAGQGPPATSTPPAGPTAAAGEDRAATSPAEADPALTNGARPGRIPSGTLTMLVSDIAGSTEMAEQLGDQAWIEVLHTHNSAVRQRVAQHGGTEVKAQGDGFLVVFPSARAAVLAAIAIQRAMHEYCDEHPDLPVQVRLGLHTGEVVVADDDVFGRNVVVASRIADAARPGEIVVSSLTRDLTASASDLGFDDGEDVELKGMAQRWRVHRVLWS